MNSGYSRFAYKKTAQGKAKNNPSHAQPSLTSALFAHDTGLCLTWLQCLPQHENPSNVVRSSALQHTGLASLPTWLALLFISEFVLKNEKEVHILYVTEPQLVGCPILIPLSAQGVMCNDS